MDLSFYDDIAGIERYVNLPAGSLKGIPIYGRKPAIDAILKLRDMESKSLFRSGLYYIVLADLCGNTAFNAKYGNGLGDTRTQWFHTVALESLGQVSPNNFLAFNKTIGDASLMIFSAFKDVLEWSRLFTRNLNFMSTEVDHFYDQFNDEAEFEEFVKAFHLRGRRLVHLGEVNYVDKHDPICLAVSQTFKIEKEFSEVDLGCTQPVANIIKPLLKELGVSLVANKPVEVPGYDEKLMTYYVK